MWWKRYANVLVVETGVVTLWKGTFRRYCTSSRTLAEASVVKTLGREGGAGGGEGGGTGGAAGVGANRPGEGVVDGGAGGAVVGCVFGFLVFVDGRALTLSICGIRIVCIWFQSVSIVKICFKLGSVGLDPGLAAL